jgi:superfamily II RNA helicase
LTGSIVGKCCCGENVVSNENKISSCYCYGNGEDILLFENSNYNEIMNTLKIFENKQVYVNRKHVLNSLATHMRENELLPSIVFVFSRKKCGIIC